MRVYRIQDIEGRGPFRPGFSCFWANKYFRSGHAGLPTWMEEFGEDLIDLKGASNEYFGSAVRTIDQIGKWFSPTECRKLEIFGYNLVSIKILRILAESKNQLVFAKRKPLTNGVIVIPWASLSELAA